jgi:hypothetical protein
MTDEPDPDNAGEGRLWIERATTLRGWFFFSAAKVRKGGFE